ncbi:MAG TPA: matrixin family metalloprotease [Pyrinomonadaceae bacterium]|nr:matrixin family metalloprotease [Pyrinomonadaceae bacterium]
MRTNKIETILTALLLAVFTVVGISAAGPLNIWNKDQRIPYRWDVSTPVPIYTDLGPFEVLPANPPAGTVLVTNEIADQTVAFAASQWSSVETSSFRAQVVGDFAAKGLPDVKDAPTAAQVIGADNGGGLFVIYDADAKIMRDFFGAPSGVLGIASPEFADEATGTITEGWIVINAQPRWFNDNQLSDYASVFTHEMGHAINLAHSQTNGAIILSFDTYGPKSCSTVPYPTNVTVNDIETMHPFIDQRPNRGGAAMSTVDIADDKASISDLYPAPGYPNTKASIRGRILETDGRTGITGVNVIARNLDNPYVDAVSAMSGDYVRVASGDDGTFTLNGLTPGARYALYSDMIVRGGFPTLQPAYLPEGEEFYSGASESGDGLIDDRCHMESITVTAGDTAEADIILNKVKGAPEFVPMVPGVFARSISADGTVIGGGISGGGSHRWTEATGLSILSQVQNADAKMARDGLTFASNTTNTGAPNGLHVASKLTLGSPWQQLPFPVAQAPEVVMQTCSALSSATAISGDGRSVGGYVYVDTNGSLPGQTCRVRPVVWTGESATILPVPPTNRNARPTGLSDDLSIVVGWDDTNSVRQGVRWENGQMIAFGTPQLFVQEASYVTPDGKTVMGANAGPEQKPWIWTREGGLKMLPRVAPRFSAVALSASDNGKIIGGLGGSFSEFPGDASGSRAFMWTEELGSVDFENFLKSQGTFFEGWILFSTSSISADGTEFVGSGFTPRGGAGWLIRMDKVNICHAPPGNPSRAQTISVPFIDTMGDHLRHGDTIGVCTDSE